MIRATTKYFIEKAIDDELHFATTKKALFHSDHEAYAVLAEEGEEMEDEFYKVIAQREELWESIKDEDSKGVSKNKSIMLRIVKDLIGEAVQVAAMLEKFSVRKGEKNE